MALTDAQKVAIRKYCGYPLLGGIPVANFSWRYSDQYGDLEFYMNNLSIDEENEIVNFYLPNLLLLKQDIPIQVRTNADTSQAAVWYRNKNELKERWTLYDSMRRDLCDFLGCPYGPGLNKNMRIVP